ncbi:FeoA domain-containing protein [Asaia prunellae]|uniref:FeoA domain-containing protein n=1 Tax=Asaia prunellae TaxID=610245 RepID=UPI000B243A55
MTLDTLPKGAHAIVSQVVARMEDDPIATRLGELGFIPGPGRDRGHRPCGA